MSGPAGAWRVEDGLVIDPRATGFFFHSDRLWYARGRVLTVLTPWPRPLAFRLDSRGRWRRARPEFRIVPEDTRTAPAHQRYLASFPAAVVSCLRGLHEGQWAMIRFASLHPHAIDLMESSLALAFALAHAGQMRGVQVATSEIRRALGWRQREIAAWLGFDGGQRAVNLLRKVVPRAIGLAELNTLRRWLRQGDPLAIRHLPRITQPVVWVLGAEDIHQYLTHAALLCIAGMRDPEGWGDNGPILTGMAVMSALRQINDALWDERTRRAVAGALATQDPPTINPSLAERVVEACGRHGNVPPSPVADGEGIAHLTTIADIVLEGAAQRNCVHDLIPSVAAGGLHLYRMTAPERATIAIEPHAGRWVLSEIEGPKGRAVGPAAVRAALDWLAAHERDRFGHATESDVPVSYVSGRSRCQGRVGRCAAAMSAGMSAASAPPPAART